MLDLARIDDGDGLESAMRMRADPASLPRRRKARRSCVIEQQERRHFSADIRVRKDAAHGKPVAYPMALVVTLNKSKFFHD
jgi:hypothetical protein